MSIIKKNVEVDPIVMAVLDSRFQAIVEQVAIAMARTSMSPIFAEARDISAGIFDRDLRLIAQKDYLPILAANIPVALRDIFEKWEGDIHEGDIFVHNDPYGSNSHQPDINVAKPVFYKGQLVFWVVTKGHHVDIGGKGLCGYDPTARTCWDDGIIIKPCKLYEKGEKNHSTWNLICHNTKLPGMVEADLNCQVGACNVGERAVLNVVERYGVDSIYASLDDIFDRTEKGFREQIRQVKDGVYYAEKAIDDDAVNRGIPVYIRAKVIVDDGDITIDLSESDPQTPSYLNSCWGNTYSNAFIPIFFFMEGDVTRNEGALRPSKIVTQKGTCVDPEFPAANTMNTCTFTETIVEVVLLALKDAKPEWSIAGHGKMSLHLSGGFNPRTKRDFAIIDFVTCGAGSGGTEGHDGWPQAGPGHCMGMLRQPDPEIMELCTPQTVWRNELVGGREGFGKFRGGFATAYKVQYDADAAAVECGHGHAPWAVPFGIFGGGSPPPSAPKVTHRDGSVTPIMINTFWDIKEGDIYEQEMQGGAGWGDPLERDPERVWKDVDDEFLTIEKAEEIYGVVIDQQAHKIDYEATKKVREEKQKEKKA